MATSARSKPSRHRAQGPIGNANGLIVPKTEPNLGGGSSRPPVRTETPPESKSWLDRAGELIDKGEIKFLADAKDKVNALIDKGVEASGYNPAAMVAGAIGKAVVTVLAPDNVIDLIPGGKGASGANKARKAMKGAEAAADAAKASGKVADARRAEKAAKSSGSDAGKGGKGANGSGGGRSNGSGNRKRRARRRCELVPYDELECAEGQQAHHVIPDWLLRYGKRGGMDRIAGMPSLAKGPAICLEAGSGGEHNAVHKHTDRPVERVAKSGRRTGVPGTVTLGQAKAISSRAVEKATGGKKGGGCDRRDIQEQLDEHFKAHNETLLRGVKHAGKITGSIRDALGGGKD